MILTIKDPNGTEVTELNGYNYVTVGDVSGFDITTTKGLVTLADNYEIASTGTNTQEWEVTVTFINLDTDQNDNTGKSFSANLIIQDSEYKETLANHIISLYTKDGDNNLYYHDGVGDYEYSHVEAGDNSYRYSGGLVFSQKAIDAGYLGMYNSPALNGVDIKGHELIKSYCDGEYSVRACSAETSMVETYTTAYDETVHYTSYNDAKKQALKDGYLEDEVENYVCFGSDTTPCPVDNLYRIIGVFDGQVKLIKVEYASSETLGTDGAFIMPGYTDEYPSEGGADGIRYNGEPSYYKGSIDYHNISIYNIDSDNSAWTESKLNTVNLNTNFLNSFASKWQDKIAVHDWHVGKINCYVAFVKTIYDFELGIYADTLTNSAKIGLMYVSDYGYAASPDLWGTDMYYNFDRVVNDDRLWIHGGLAEWTITTNSRSRVLYVSPSGNVDINGDSPSLYANALRPCFYLNEDVEFSGGTGTQSDPYRLVA